jgi:uncharacterized RDD family membrane protein YckC
MDEVLAHPGKRFQGQFIDGIATYFFGYASFFALACLLSKDVAGYAGIVIGLVYFLFCDSLPNGQSLGKRLLKIKVIDRKTKNPCSVIQSLLRNITFPLGFFDWIFIFFGSHRRFGDFLASTIVIKA